MGRSLLVGLALLSLAACGKKEAPPAEADVSGGPQIATSLDDYALPVDRSDQITSIDAATGDAAGMPKDGGAVVSAPKPQPRPAVVAAETVVAPLPATPAPLIPMPAAPTVTGDRP